MPTPRLNKATRTKNMRRLMEQHKRHCARCFVKVETVPEARILGWVIGGLRNHYLYDRGIRVAAIATIQHVIPIVRGGKNHISNMTLWCAACNNDDSKQHKDNP